MLVSLAAWGARLEMKLESHTALPHHVAVPDMVDRRIGDQMAILKAQNGADVGALAVEIRHLREEVTRMRQDLAKMQERRAQP